MAENLFEVLGVTPFSSAEDISAAFRSLSRAGHPDVGGDPIRYTDISNAYSVLKDAKKRQAYIQFLELTQQRCQECKGTGVQWKQRGFSGGVLIKCTHCGGGGFCDNR